VWLALLKWLGFCLGTKKDVAKMIKKSRATHNVVAAWHTEAEKSTHIIDVCARFTFFTHVSTEERKVFVLDRRGTMEARTSEEKKRALTACLGIRDCASLLEVNKCFRRATQKYWRTTANNHWHNEPTISAVSFKQSRKRTRGSCNSRSWRSLECCASWLLLQPTSLA